MLRLGHKQKGRRERIVAMQEELARSLAGRTQSFAAYAAPLPRQLLAGRADRRARAQCPLRSPRSRRTRRPLPVVMKLRESGAPPWSRVYAPDQPGLFYRLAGAISLAGGNIIDARIHTTADGMALDNFLVQDGRRGPLRDRHQLKRLEEAVLKALEGQEPSAERLAARALPLRRAEAFAVQPAVFIDNKASNRYTVVEVNARDRAALLSELAQALFDNGDDPLRPYRDLWRARGRRLLSDRSGRREDRVARLAQAAGELAPEGGGGPARRAARPPRPGPRARTAARPAPRARGRGAAPGWSRG